MLEGSFYTIHAAQTEGNTLTGEVRFDANHKIFEGHFPHQPVVPGVCMMQLIKEQFNKVQGQTYQLREGQNLKFMAMIDPQRTPAVQLNLSWQPAEEGFWVTATLQQEGTTFLKYKARFA
jgi:3-hydroxyacyl-[acyl-carrier-protein] dehydratase